MDAITNADRLFKIIFRCARNQHKPDLHSFVVPIKNGIAYVECRSHEVFIQERYEDKTREWCGTAVAASNRLDKLGADAFQVDM